MSSDKIKNFLLVLTSIAIGLIICELVLRIKCDGTGFCPSKYFEASSQSNDLYVHSDIIHHLAPNKKIRVDTHDFSVVYQTNELGVRDDLNITASKENKIIALGESQTFGEGVYRKNTFVERLEKNIGIEIVNFGNPGHGIGQIYYHYKYKVKKLENVKGIVLFALHTLYYRNHIRDHKLGELNSYDFKINSQNSPTSKIKNNLYFEFLYFIKYFTLWFEQKDSLLSNSKDRWKNKKTPYEESIMFLNRTDEKDARLKKFLGLIKNAKSDLPFCVVNISVYNLDLLNKLKNEIGFKYIDLSKEIVQRSQQYKLRFEYDRHYNSRTHEFIAKKLKDKLEGCLIP